MKLRATLLLIVVLLTGTTASADSNQYLQAGIPAVNREWASPDYARTAEILQSGAVPLPTLADEAGKAVLDRLLSLENFSLAQNTTLPIESRLDEIMNIQMQTNSIAKMYLAKVSHGEGYASELVRILAFQLYCMSEVIPILQEFVASIPNFENQPIRVAGRKKMFGSVMKMFAGAEIAISDTNMYVAHDASLLLKAMADTLPTVKLTFTVEYREELRIKLLEDRDHMSDPADIANINRMLLELSAP